MFATAIRYEYPTRSSNRSGVGKGLEGSPGELCVEPHRACGEPVRVENAHQQARVRNGWLGAAPPVAGGPGHRACAAGPNRDVAGRRDRNDAASPAPTLEISTESALMMRSCSSSNVLLTNGWPSTISETSVDVPPTSAQSRLPSPIASPRRALEIVPAAGPAKTIRNGCSSASAHGSKVAAQSAKLRSPVKPSPRSSASSSCEYSVKILS